MGLSLRLFAPHIMVVSLRAYPVRGESQIQ